MLVLGIVAAAGGSRYAAALAHHRVERAAQRIAADIDAARHMARCRNAAVTLTFSATGYSAVGMPNPNHPAAPFAVQLNDGVLQASLSDINVGGDLVLIFNSFGLPDSGGSLRVSSGGTSKTLTITAGTGATTIL